MAGDSASDEEVLRDLAQRLLTHHHPDGPTSGHLFLRRLPDSSPLDIPLPQDSTLLGSVLYARSGRPTLIEAVLDSARPPTSLLSTYRTDLAAGGWSPFEPEGSMRGGFVSGEMGDGGLFRVGNSGPMLIVEAVARSAAPTDVRVRLDWDMPRHMQPRDHHGVALGAERIPVLRTPPGVELRAQGSSGSSGRWTTEASVHTDRPVAELEAHFAGQLVQARWKRLAGRADDVVGWSSWQLPGEGEWLGLLLVLAPFKPGERSLTLRIEEGRQHDGDDGTTSVLTSRLSH